jgi:oxaloacetate decarboxylase gamma subunit
MDIGALLIQAASLMLTGMIGVFVFLSILILVVTSLSQLTKPDSEAATTPTTRRQPSGEVSNAHIAAITAAIAQYRTK